MTVGSERLRSDGSLPNLLTTGVPNLDAVLGGGIQRRALGMVLGPPGSGKTVLCQQIAFHVARAGGQVLYLTGQSEMHEKLVRHQRVMAFFDPALVGAGIQFVNLSDLLREGVPAAEDAVVAAARAQRAALVVVDGYAGMRRMPADPAAASSFVYSLGAKLSLLGVTTLFAVEADPIDRERYGELTVCDVVLALRNVQQGTWDRRILQVLKVRGAASLNGIHPFTIDDDGVHVHPRFESIVAPDPGAWSDERVQCGIAALDALLGGGLNLGTATLVAGTPGAGKTLLALHLLVEGARRGEPGLFVGFLESPEQLRAKARAFGLDLAVAEQSGLVRLLVFPGYDLNADRIGEELRIDVAVRGVKRLAIDSFSELERAIYTEDRKPNFLAALVHFVRGQGVTAYLAMDVPKIVGVELDLAGTPLAVFAENLLLLRQTELLGEMRRILAILKMRFSAHDSTVMEYALEPDRGVRLLGPAPLAVGLLTGLGHPIAHPDSVDGPRGVRGGA